jgi:hypothetical protein
MVRHFLLVLALVAIIPALALPLLAGIAAFCIPAAVIAGIASLAAPGPAPAAAASDARDQSANHRNGQSGFSG